MTNTTKQISGYEVSIIRKGDSYGLTGSLTARAMMVEFARDGQFVARYNAATLAGETEYAASIADSGLCIDIASGAGLSAAEGAELLSWLEANI